jgi:hypothetical protein
MKLLVDYAARLHRVHTIDCLHLSYSREQTFRFLLPSQSSFNMLCIEAAAFIAHANKTTRFAQTSYARRRATTNGKADKLENAGLATMGIIIKQGFALNRYFGGHSRRWALVTNTVPRYVRAQQASAEVFYSRQ